MHALGVYTREELDGVCLSTQRYCESFHVFRPTSLVLEACFLTPISQDQTWGFMPVTTELYPALLFGRVSYPVAQAGLEPSILLPQLSE